MRLIGGGARSPLWRQILADVLGLPILLPELVTEATSLGAAIAGGVGVGIFDSFAAADRFIHVHEAARPEASAQAHYAELVAAVPARPTAAWNRSSASYADPINPFLAFDNPHVLWYVIPNMCYG